MNSGRISQCKIANFKLPKKLLSLCVFWCVRECPAGSQSGGSTEFLTVKKKKKNAMQIVIFSLSSPLDWSFSARKM